MFIRELSFNTGVTPQSDQSALSKTDPAALIQPVQAGDLRALARLLTILERQGPSALVQIPELLQPPTLALRIGLTGPPGAGKSTLIGQLIGEWRKRGKKVGVIAVDPSSPFSQGAVLGDRIRYSAHFNDPGVFIRSLGSRGSLGGLSSSAYLMVRAFDLAGFDILLLETVGVGQTELEIMHVADLVSVVLVPESGDSIQGMKAGLMEIADLYVVNKADRPGADLFAHELQSTLALDPRGPTKPITIMKTVAINGTGVNEFIGHVEAFANREGENSWRERPRQLHRLRAEGRALLRAKAEREIASKVNAVDGIDAFKHLFDS